MKKLFTLLLAYLIISSIVNVHAQEKSSKGLDKAQVMNLVDSLRNVLTSYYIFPEKASLMSKYLGDQLKKGAYNHITDPLKLAARLGSDLKSVHYDSHLHVNFEPGLVAPKMMKPEERANAMKAQLAAERDDNFNLKKVEVLPGNIGYFLFNGFTGYINEAKPMLNGALTFLSGTKALIIDLRSNGGGYTANRLESYFFKEKTHLFDNINTISKDTVSVFADPSTTNGPILLMPIYILTSKNTFSAAEAFSSAMQSLKRAVIVGENTGGGSHMAGVFDLKNGFNAKIPFARPISTATFKDWEGVGVIPDIPVPASKALHKAQEIIYKDMLTKATSDQEKMRIQWAINALIAEQNEPNANANLYSNYVGTYTGGIKFYIENNQLLCKNPERGGTEVFKLAPVIGDIFILDENVQIEFVRNEKNVYSSLKMLWKNGGVTRKNKE